MSSPIRAASILAFALILVPQSEARAQQRRDTLRGSAATSAEELHRLRRDWLERRRLGLLDQERPSFGSAVVGAPRAGTATGIATGAPIGYGAWRGGASALHCSAFVAPAFGGGWWSFDSFGALAFRGSCLPAHGWSPRGPVWWEGRRGPDRHDGWRDFLPYPAYPPVGRFYHRFQRDPAAYPDPFLFGIQEFGWGYYGPWRSYPGPFGWRDGAYGWSFGPGWGSGPSECVVIGILRADGIEHRIAVGLQTLGLADPRDLDLAIDARLSRGETVLLYGLDGRILRIEPGTAIDDIRVTPCE